MTIRVIIVDTETNSRRRTSAALATDPDLEVVGLARDPAEGLRLVLAVAPNVVVLASPYGGAGSLDFIRAAVAGRPAVYVLVLARTSDAQYLQAAMQAGAQAFLSQPAPADVLIATVKASAKLN